jgi:HK97 family phage portal protein
MGIINIFKRKSNSIGAVYPVELPDAIWTPQNYERLSKAGYEQNPAVKACVDLISETVASISWQLFQTSSGEDAQPEEIDNHPILDLIHRPNDDQTEKQFKEEVMKNYLLAGNNFTYGIKPDTGPNVNGIAKMMMNLKPHRVQIIQSNNITSPIGGYKYSVRGRQPVRFKPEEILHIKDYHPTNDWYGLSKLGVVARAIDISNMIDEWHNKLLRNDCRPPGAWNYKGGQLTDEQQLALEKTIEEKFAGYKNVGKPPVLGGGEWEWIDFGITPRDMDHKSTAIHAMRQICGIFNVPSEVLWDTEQKTYSNYQEARKALYMETILPYCDMLAEEFTQWFKPSFQNENYFIGYDKNQIEAIQEDRQKKFDYLSKADFLEDNEKRNAVGYDELPYGNTVFKPLSMMPVGAVNGTNTDDTDDAKTAFKVAKNGGFWTVPERKEILWNNFVMRVKAKEKPYEKLAIEYMDDQKKRIKKELDNHKVLSAIEPEFIINIEDEAHAYQRKFQSWYSYTFQHAGEAGIEATKGQLYNLESKAELEFVLTPDYEELIQQMMFNSGTTVNNTLIDIIYRTYQRAMKEDWTVESLTQMINHSIDEFKPWRARLWSRTETAKMENWGQLEGYKKQEFVDRKGWLSAFAPDTREAHQIADQDYSDNPIPLDDPFFVDGEELQYPGDPAGSPGNICNCLCSTFPEVTPIQ